MTECASGRDFRTGFYQVEIPLDARKYFRFKTDDGHWYELTRLPMGYSCAPEIMCYFFMGELTGKAFGQGLSLQTKMLQNTYKDIALDFDHITSSLSFFAHADNGKRKQDKPVCNLLYFCKHFK